MSETEKCYFRQRSIKRKTAYPLSKVFYVFNQNRHSSDLSHTWVKSSFSKEKWGSLSNVCMKTRCKRFAILPMGHLFYLKTGLVALTGSKDKSGLDPLRQFPVIFSSASV